MRILTRLPDGLTAQLSALDPADPGPIVRPPVDDLLSRASAGEVDVTVGEPVRRRASWLAPVAAAAVILAVVVGVAVTRPATHHGHEAAHGGTTTPTTDAPSMSSSAEPLNTLAQQLWADFPVHASPRPVVLIGDAVAAPQHGFPNDDTKIAFIQGKVTMAVALPSTPGSRNGYPLVSAADALGLLVGPQVSGVSVAPLRITAMSLTDHAWQTDRGVASLPSWQLRFAEVPDPAYILAVAQSARYDGNSTPLNDTAASATLSRDGRTLVVPFVQYSASAVCRAGFTTSISVEETSTAVVIASNTTQIPPVSASSTACGDVGNVQGAGAPAPPYRPGETHTMTIHLQAPLGNRAVVDADGHPYVVTGP